VELVGYLHIKDVLDLDGELDEVVPAERVRALPRLSVEAPVDEALATMRREGSHLARAVDGEGTTVGVVALEDLVEEYVGTVRDSTHVARSAARGTS
jgi:CBS domain containing-hemolysin-like protein